MALLDRTPIDPPTQGISTSPRVALDQAVSFAVRYLL